MATLRAAWQVQAGLIPGTPMPDYSKSWFYTYEHYESDGMERGDTFSRLQAEATAWAANLQECGLNWVSVEYLWY